MAENTRMPPPKPSVPPPTTPQGDGGQPRAAASVACPFCRGTGRDVTDPTLSCYRCGGVKVVRMTTGADLIAAERQRQQEVEGWTPEHDAEHGDDALVLAASCYATPDAYRGSRRVPVQFRESGRWEGTGVEVPYLWPWAGGWWKPTPDDRVRELVKAGALIAAEIDRLNAQRAVQSHE